MSSSQTKTQQYESPKARRQRLIDEWKAAQEAQKPESEKGKGPSTLAKTWESVKEAAAQAAETIKTKTNYDERAKQAAKGRK